MSELHLTTLSVCANGYEGDGMSFGDAITTCLGKYLEFGGRARRSEYWFFYLFVAIVNWGLFLAGAPALSSLASLALLLPVLAAAARRMHDTNRSGWYLLLGLIPIVGWIIVIIALATDSDRGPNQYGESPKPAAF